MRILRFFTPSPLPVGSTVALSAAAFHHAVRVLRLKPGTPLTVFNGSGGECRAVLKTIDKRQAFVRILEWLPIETESPLSIQLVQGVARGERMDYALQKAVELGVDAIRPVLTERSVNLDEDRRARRLQHWRGVVAGACEQCGRNRLPPIAEPVDLRAWLAMERPPGLALVLDPTAECRLGELERAPAATLLIGPEGGLSEQEVDLAATVGFTRVRLGPRILRTETAATAALAALQTLWGDLGS